MIAVVDYGMGNIHSCLKAISLYSNDYMFTSDPEKIKNSKAIILPGDGAFEAAIKNLRNSGLFTVITEEVKKGKPILGICIGFQILFQFSEEAKNQDYSKGFSFLNGDVKKFSGKNYKVPHIGWNKILISKKNRLLKDLTKEVYMYFIHSYRVKNAEEKAVIANCNYYSESFPAVIEFENIFGTQFHPEKSHTQGLKIIKNFVELI